MEFLAAAELIVLVVDGDENAPPIDGVGLRNLQMLRSIGLPSLVCSIQGMNDRSVKSISAAKKRVTQVLTDEVHCPTIFEMAIFEYCSELQSSIGSMTYRKD